MKAHAWTEEEDAILRRLWGCGEFQDVIARAINVGRATVQRRADLLGLSQRSPAGRVSCTPEMDAALSAARAQGMDADQIGKLIGIGRDSVQRRIRQLNLPRHKPPAHLTELKIRIRELWMAGMTVANISYELRITKNSVVGHVHRMKLPSRPSPIKYDPTTPRKPRKARTPKYGGAAAVERAKRVASVAVPRVFTRAAIVRVPPAPAVSRAPRLVRLLPPAWNSVTVSAPRTCQYPGWGDDPRCRKTEFCGARCVTLQCDDGGLRSPYCLEHHVLCHKPLRTVQQDAPESEAA